MSPNSIRKKREQFALGNHIARVGIEMSPCSFCEKNGKKCIVVPEGASRCSECVRIGKKCDVEGRPAGDWAAVEREEFRLESAEMFTEDNLRKAQDAINEALNRLARLRKQKQFLRKRAADMLRRGVKSLDELDEIEERERLESEEEVLQKQQARATTASTSADVGGHLDYPSAYPLGHSGVAFDPDSVPSPSFWESVDFVGGTAP